MAWRGRGRGRGRGGGGYVKPEPHILFPDVVLPEVSKIKVTEEERALVIRSMKLQSFWKSSPYYLENPALKQSQDLEIERYSDRKKAGRAERFPLSYYLKLTPNNFPRELLEGTKRVQHDQRKVSWKSDLRKLDLLEKFELKNKDQDEKEDEEEEEEEVESDDGDDGDYVQDLHDFQDDEGIEDENGIEDEEAYDDF